MIYNRLYKTFRQKESELSDSHNNVGPCSVNHELNTRACNQCPQSLQSLPRSMFSDVIVAIDIIKYMVGNCCSDLNKAHA